ncbi:MAG TPA: hypothetical protein VK604_03790, partial [Bryobacteraceae bacterium]|nr:hypothetical protein [Bryobacteraceae bacterium]
IQQLSEQVQQLGAQQLGAQQMNAQQGSYPAAPPSAPIPDPSPAPTPVTVVLRSGQKIQVQNYAVMGDSFWDFSRQPARRIPLSSIDVGASTKATQASGGEFPAF